MRGWTAAQIAEAAGAEVLRAGGDRSGPERAVIDSRDADAGTLFVGLPGERTHGGRFATDVLQQGAYGVLTDPVHAKAAADASEGGAVLSVDDPLTALGRLANAWRHELGADVIGVTGSTGKTSTKDLLLALLGPHRRTVASRANYNTEIGLPLEILTAPAGTEVLVLEMGMRGPGQIAELARIADPSVGVIVSIGPVHLELLGSVEAIAAAKAELFEALPPGGTAIMPADEPLLEPHRPAGVKTLTFGPSGEVRLIAAEGESLEIDAAGCRVSLEIDLPQAHMRLNLLAAVAAARAIGVTPAGRVSPVLSPGRGQRLTLSGGISLIDDCYNANPMSMRAALDDLAATAALETPSRRRVAVLGDMLELGPDAPTFHEQLGEHAKRSVDVLVTVGSLAGEIAASFSGEHHHADDAGAAAELVPGLLRPGDVVLVKASRGIALEQVCQALAAAGVA